MPADRAMDPWERQRALARVTNVWGAASVIGGLAAASRPHPWWRAFGRQHVGWGVVDLALVAVLNTVQDRRMRGLADPWSSVTLERERRRLRTVLLVNVVADVGYVIGGVVLWRGRGRSTRASGAGAAIAVQGTFLALHDAHHAFHGRAERQPDGVDAHPGRSS